MTFHAIYNKNDQVVGIYDNIKEVAEDLQISLVGAWKIITNKTDKYTSYSYDITEEELEYRE